MSEAIRAHKTLGESLRPEAKEQLKSYIIELLKHTVCEGGWIIGPLGEEHFLHAGTVTDELWPFTFDNEGISLIEKISNCAKGIGYLNNKDILTFFLNQIKELRLPDIQRTGESFTLYLTDALGEEHVKEIANACFSRFLALPEKYKLLIPWLRPQTIPFNLPEDFELIIGKRARIFRTAKQAGYKYEVERYIVEILKGIAENDGANALNDHLVIEIS